MEDYLEVVDSGFVSENKKRKKRSPLRRNRNAPRHRWRDWSLIMMVKVPNSNWRNRMVSKLS